MHLERNLFDQFIAAGGTGIFCLAYVLAGMIHVLMIDRLRWGMKPRILFLLLCFVPLTVGLFSVRTRAETMLLALRGVEIRDPVIVGQDFVIDHSWPLAGLPIATFGTLLLLAMSVWLFLRAPLEESPSIMASKPQRKT